MNKFHNDSFFYHFKELERRKINKSELVKILIITEVNKNVRDTH